MSAVGYSGCCTASHVYRINLQLVLSVLLTVKVDTAAAYTGANGKDSGGSNSVADVLHGIGEDHIGPYDVLTHTGSRFTASELNENFAIVYFGATSAVDCVSELEKLAEIVYQSGELAWPAHVHSTRLRCVRWHKSSLQLVMQQPWCNMQST